MKNFDDGVRNYIKTYAVIEVNFPVDDKGNADVSCSQCPYYSRYGRECQLNKTIVAYPEKYVGQNCPLVQVDDAETAEKESVVVK